MIFFKLRFFKKKSLRYSTTFKIGALAQIGTKQQLVILNFSIRCMYRGVARKFSSVRGRSGDGVGGQNLTYPPPALAFFYQILRT